MVRLLCKFSSSFSVSVLLVCLSVSAGEQAQAAWPEPLNLTGNNLLLVANRQVPQSVQLAHHYASVRSVPARQIILLDLPFREGVSRAKYENLIARPIRQFIQQQKLEDKIRCVVLFYGLPLRVATAKASAERRKSAGQLEAQYRKRITQLEELLASLLTLEGQVTVSPQSRPAATLPADRRKLVKIIDRLNSIYRRVSNRIDAIKDPLEKRIKIGQVVGLKLKIAGPSALMTSNYTPPDQAIAQNYLQELVKIAQVRNQIRKLRSSPIETRDLDQIYNLIERVGGHLGVLKALTEDIDNLLQSNSLAAVDSELSMLFVKQYPLADRYHNTFNPRFANNNNINSHGRVLLVCRLDGPSKALVARMIDDSYRVQQTGLAGRIYLDARGLKKKDGYFVYDQNLRDTARLLNRHVPALPLILDNKPALFPPGSCRDTALYCGWYSLGKFVDAFEFVRGAVGYHIASVEAKTLHNPTSQVWCKRLLDRGIVATLGPVAEPYLDAFPLPSEFFGLLLTGRYTLVECYYLTKRYNSWRMILIGDPLYKPFESGPLLQVQQVPMTSYLPSGPVPER